jgi:UDP-N-acetylmuramoyl-tripeptide--D-alanyl-D-alanine ligase
MSIIQDLTTIIIILFLVKVVRDSFYLLWLFQVKEYRLDRMKSHIRENMRFNLSDVAIALGVFFLLGLFFPATAKFILVFLMLLAGYLAPLYFLYAFLKTILDIKRHSFKRPKPTFKIALISVLYLALYMTFVYLVTVKILSAIIITYSLDFLSLFPFYLLCLNILVPVFILLAIIIVTPFSNFQKRRVFKRARLKMQAMKKVKTIGITGSFGKTSTKEFLYSILSQKYKVVKTSGNNNTNMGVATTILRDVSDNFDYFICEMGAYKIGEVRENCELARPFAGIITGINQQHIDLFGSLQNTKKAKFELIQSLPKEGFAVINRQAEDMKPKLGYKVKDVTLFSEDLAENIKVNPDSVEFEYKGFTFKLGILGKHYIANIISAIITAEKLGMGLEEIQRAVSKIQFKSDYLMQKLEGPNNSVFIYDSYSANPTGTIAALEYLEDAYPHCKKILVFPGIIELGKDSEKIHQGIWKKADDVCSLVYVIQRDNWVIHNISQIKEKYKKSRFVFDKDFDRISTDLKKHLDKNTVVLFESRGAGIVMKKMLK